jgi:hypothetical protein
MKFKKKYISKNKMPKGVKKSQVFVPEVKKGKGQALDEIVNYIIDGGKEGINSYKREFKESFAGCHGGHTCNLYDLQIVIDKIPVKMRIFMQITSVYVEWDKPRKPSEAAQDEPSLEKYTLSIMTKIYYDGGDIPILLEDEDEPLYYRNLICKVENDIIDRNEITKNILHLFDIKNFKYCKLKNEFINSSELGRKNIVNKTIDYFELENNQGEECCICYDRTTLRTGDCNHILCLECANRLPVVDHDDGPYIKCPMCKEDVHYLSSNEADCIPHN